MTTDYDPSDLDAQDARADLNRATAAAIAKQEATDFQWLMKGPIGRRIVYRMLAQCGAFRTSFSPNAMEMARLEGGKQLGYWLLEQIDSHCPDAYATMIEEKRNP